METMKTKKHSILSAFRRILGHTPRRQRVHLVFLFIGMLVAAVLETLNVGLIALYVSYVSNPEAILGSRYMATARGVLPASWLATQGAITIFLSVLLVCALAAKSSLQALVTYWGSRLAAHIEAFFGSLLLDGFLRMPYAWHQTRNSADLVLAVQWAAFFGRVFIDPFLRALSDVVMVTFLLTSLVLVRPFISMGMLVVLGGVAFFLFITIRRRVTRVAARCKEYNQSISRHITKAIHGIKDVKVSGREAFFLEDYQNDVYPLARAIGLQQFLTRSPVWILELVGFVMLAVTICVMSTLMDASTAEITATMALLAVTAYRVLPALNKVLAGVTKMHTALPYIDGQFEYLDLFAKHIDPEEHQAATVGPLEFEHAISFENVSFAYEEATQEALEGIDMTIKKGATIGVIGPSGAGKSTFVDMLIGLLAPTQGAVKIDGKELVGSLRGAWVRSIGYVAQAPYIYDGTLAGNVAFGCRGADIDRERVLACCEQAAMQEFMKDLSDGIDTPIGERGIRLSGGQQQRVVIARALYSRPSVMLFDEATSSLDTKSEKAIQNTIYTFKGKQTLVVVAHRLSTVEDCDTLVWLDKGRIRKIGPPAEILGEYHEAMHDVEDES